jgi:hypothetical protein
MTLLTVQPCGHRDPWAEDYESPVFILDHVATGVVEFDIGRDQTIVLVSTA